MTAERERLARLVHEIRSPVAALAAVGEALTDVADPESRRRLLELAVAACQGIERLVRDVAMASLRLEEVDVARLVEHVAMSASMTSSRSVVVRPEVAPLEIRADPLRIRQALDNLVRNAVAVSPPEEEVRIGVVVTAASVLLTVADAGPGIAEADRDRIFEPGVRLDEEHPGSGLGLAVSRAIAEAHGGSLTVESALGAGTTFTLVLPLTYPATRASME
jgi:two-component system OmpR family sensor kinase